MGNAPAATDFSKARKAMIDSQLRTSGVSDAAVLGRMSTLAREEYVPANMCAAAYQDRAVALQDGHYLGSPLFYGKLLSAAAPTLDDKALVVDAGSGYLTALLEPMVRSLESISPADAASRVKRGDYTLLVIDGAIADLPDGLIRSLKNGGRIATGLVNEGVTRVAEGRNIDGQVDFRSVIEIGIPQLEAFTIPAGWSF